MEANFCIGCGKKVGLKAMRCHSCANRETWQRPGEKEKRMKAMNHPVAKEKLRKAMVEAHKRPEVKERYKKAMNHPEVKEKRRKAIKEAQNRPEVKKRCKEVHNRPEVRERHRKAAAEAMNRPEVKEKHRKAMVEAMNRPDVKERHILALNCPEVREKHSKTTSRLICEGRFNPVSHAKHGWFYSVKNKKKLWYRSSYELQAYKILEQLAKVVKYETEPFYIPYRFQGIEKNYVPDILVTYDDGTQELIEVMSTWQLEDVVRQAKFVAARKYCDEQGLKFSVWTEENIKKVRRDVG